MADTYTDVLAAWDQAPEEDIHPLWSVDRDAYWQSGWDQVSDATVYARKGSLAVDFGCGNGRLTVPLAKLGYQTIAADASQKQLDLTAAHLKDAGVQAELLHTDGSDLAKQLGKRKAAVIMARGVMIHHSHDDAEWLLKRMASALKRGGVIITDLPLADHSHTRTHWRDVTYWTRPERDAMIHRIGMVEIEDGDVVALRKK